MKYIKPLIVLLIIYIVLPTNIYGVTLKDYEDKVNKYKNDIAAKQRAINNTKTNIKNTEDEIDYIKSTMKRLAKEVEELEEKNTQNEKEIQEKSEETKSLVEYMQYASGENIYLEYIFGADTVTDLIYRMSIVQQMTEYNEEVISNLRQMIDDNNKRSVVIEQKQIEMKNQQGQLEKKVVSLGNEQASLVSGSLSDQKQLKIYQDIVNSYKKQGCKSTDRIGIDCAKTASAGVWRRPIVKGYITSEVGPRWGSFHQGLDMSTSNPYKAKIYPVANGTITAKYIDTYGALVIVMEHYNSADGKWYSTLYCHMSKYAPNLYVGKKLTSNDYIGYMGSTGWSTGPHLHLELVPCRLYKDSTCKTWSKYASYVRKLYNQGYKFARKFIKFPSRWTTRD